MKSFRSIILIVSLIPIVVAFPRPTTLRPKTTPSSLSTSTTLHSSNNGNNANTNNANANNNANNANNNNEESISIEQYSSCLSPSQERNSIRKESNTYSPINYNRPKWQSTLVTPLKKVGKMAMSKLGKAVWSRGASSDAKPGSLVLMRCGESEWTKTGRFTGWADPDLVGEGVLEIEHAGRLLLSEGYEPDIIYTSRLKRAVKSTWTILNSLEAPYLPVYKSWRLNERNYGALTGLKKMDAAEMLGTEVVQAWRNSLRARPPPMKRDDPYYPGNDRRYEDLTEDQIPLTESLMDCMQRARPLWEYSISKEIKKGNTVLVVAHTNTLRGLMQVIDGISEKDIQEVSMPGGIPFVYKFDSEMKPLPPAEGKISQAHTSGIFLEKPGLLKEALKRTEEWDNVVPGFLNQPATFYPKVQRQSTVEASLLELKEEKVKAERSAITGNAEATVVGDPNDDGQLIITNMANGAPTTSPIDPEDEEEFEEFDARTPDAEDEITLNIQKADEASPGVIKQGDTKDPVVVFVRHGRTPHNNLGLFTGWADPPLAPDGVEDAKNAGRLLKMHGFEFDVVYTSWLQRAIETAWYCVDELDEQWLPMVKSWRLNERMYGALTGKSKQMIANEYGEDQLKKWRRGFKIQPPPVSSYSLSYPGNDYKRTKYVKDLRISLMETINRSIEAKEFQIHRKFPKAESLWDCMQRSIPFYTQRIVPEAVNQGKRVLITSHENAIRGILMHLCEIPEEAMNQLHLPNGLPLVYNVKRKCITLLDDGSGIDPMEVHDFGPAAQYLFRPCELDDDFFDQMEQQALANQEGSSESKEAVAA